LETGTGRSDGALFVNFDVGVVGPDGVDRWHAWNHKSEGDFDDAMRVLARLR